MINSKSSDLFSRLLLNPDFETLGAFESLVLDDDDDLYTNSS